MPKLHASKRLITSPFGLIGTDENALTFALAYTFQQCPQLLQWFLKQNGIHGIQRAQLRHARIDLQRHSSQGPQAGISDIEIRLPGHFHVIVEAKVGLSVPSLTQCCKYLPSKPIELPNPLTTGAGMYNRRIRCDFDLLLTCSTVKQIQDTMSERRSRPVSKG